MYDGAEIFKNIRQANKKVLDLTANKRLITTIGYSFPTGVEAQNKMKDAIAAKHELLTFMEVSQDNTVAVSFKFGENFKTFLKEYAQKHGLKKATLLNKEKRYLKVR